MKSATSWWPDCEKGFAPRRHVSSKNIAVTSLRAGGALVGNGVGLDVVGPGVGRGEGAAVGFDDVGPGVVGKEVGPAVGRGVGAGLG